MTKQSEIEQSSSFCCFFIFLLQESILDSILDSMTYNSAKRFFALVTSKIFFLCIIDMIVLYLSSRCICLVVVLPRVENPWPSPRIHQNQENYGFNIPFFSFIVYYIRNLILFLLRESKHVQHVFQVLDMACIQNVICLHHR